MDRKARREAREAKHFPYAHGVTHTRPIVANGSHFNSANSEMEPVSHDSYGSEGWRPTPDHPLFDEQALLSEICRVWGGYGAHAEVMRDLIKRASSSAALFGGDVEDGVSVDARERGARAGSQR